MTGKNKYYICTSKILMKNGEVAQLVRARDS
jgi:hypothetical protein